MTDTRDAATRTVTGSWSLFLSLALLMLGNGLLGTLIGVRSELEGFRTAVTGAVMASYYVGFLVGSQAVPRVVSRVGHIRVFAGLASLASAAALLHAVEPSPVLWAFMRLLFGLSMAGLYVVAESWLNERATNANRGVLLSLYMVVVMGGAGTGQLLLGVGPPESFELFILASVLVSAAVVPISLSVSEEPPLAVEARIRVKAMWKAAPLGIVGGVLTGMANGAFIGMGPVYATAVGMSPERVALFMAAAFIGAVALQMPIGAMSDRMHRRRAILLVTVAAAAVTGGATQLPVTGPWLLLAMLFFGGVSFPLYSLNLSHINDQLPVGQAVAASSMFVFVTGIGAIAGPLIAATSMTAFGNRSFFAVLTAFHTAMGLFALYRIAARRGMAIELQKAYAAVPARASAMVAALLRPRNGDKG